MALVSQETYLFNAPLTVNLIYGLNIPPSVDELWQALRQARLADFIHSLPLGLETEIGDRGVNLSGGERQRLAIARALLRKAEILILDEATSALDSNTESLIQSSLQELIAGKSSVVIAHRLSTIRHANQIIVLDQGRVVEQGNVDQLLQQKGKFYEYWEKQKFF
jgi:ABC-type multidrug transport system fused ATPase/permease subunit